MGKARHSHFNSGGACRCGDTRDAIPTAGDDGALCVFDFIGQQPRVSIDTDPPQETTIPGACRRFQYGGLMERRIGVPRSDIPYTKIKARGKAWLKSVIL